jgi:hypothetical protein
MEFNSWFQDGFPQSYKIQLLYKTNTNTKERYVDTPFRFKTYSDASKSASEIYNDVLHRIVGSNDSPHWTVSSDKLTKHEIKDKNWYNVHGISKTPLSRPNH